LLRSLAADLVEGSHGAVAGGTREPFALAMPITKEDAMTTFYDAAEWRNIPAHANACVYADGAYSAVPDRPEVLSRFAAVRWITVLGGSDAARYAGCCDYEQGNAAFGGTKLRDWAEQRKAMGCRARVYSDRANLSAAHAHVGDLPNVLYWVATLDNQPWTAASLAADIHRNYGVTIPASLIWANQNKGGQNALYDQSTLFARW
jgi:hypothetical protein